MWVQFEGAMTSMIHLGFTEKDIDEVKGIFSDSHLYLLLATFIVSTLHASYFIVLFQLRSCYFMIADRKMSSSPH